LIADKNAVVIVLKDKHALTYLPTEFGYDLFGEVGESASQFSLGVGSNFSSVSPSASCGH
jgi:hypothetical protein